MRATYLVTRWLDRWTQSNNHPRQNQSKTFKVPVAVISIWVHVPAQNTMPCQIFPESNVKRIRNETGSGSFTERNAIGASGVEACALTTERFSQRTSGQRCSGRRSRSPRASQATTRTTTTPRTTLQQYQQDYFYWKRFTHLIGRPTKMNRVALTRRIRCDIRRLIKWPSPMIGHSVARLLSMAAVPGIKRRTSSILIGHRWCCDLNQIRLKIKWFRFMILIRLATSDFKSRTLYIFGNVTSAV